MPDPIRSPEVSVDYSALDTLARDGVQPLLIVPAPNELIVLKPPRGVKAFKPLRLKRISLSAPLCACPKLHRVRRHHGHRPPHPMPAVAPVEDMSKPVPTPKEPMPRQRAEAPPSVQLPPPVAAGSPTAPVKPAAPPPVLPAPAMPQASSGSKGPTPTAKPLPLPAPQTAVAPPTTHPAPSSAPPPAPAATAPPQVLTPPPPAAKPAETPAAKPAPEPPQMAALPPAPQPKSLTDQPLVVAYRTGESAIPDASAPNLKDLAQRVSADATLRVQLLAYASDPEKNVSRARRLSLERAIAVRKMLIDSGLDATRIEVRALGDQNSGGAADRVDVIVSVRR